MNAKNEIPGGLSGAAIHAEAAKHYEVIAGERTFRHAAFARTVIAADRALRSGTAPAGDVLMPVVWVGVLDDALVTLASALAAMGAKDTEIARLREEDEINTDTISRMSKILAEIAISLKGEESPLHRHGYADLAEMAQKNMLELNLFRNVEFGHQQALAAMTSERDTACDDVVMLTAEINVLRRDAASATGAAAIKAG